MSRFTLTLMRHAKSGWGNPALSDHDRTLNDRGNRDAPDMAQRLVERNSIPDFILCSSAIRTQETTAHLLNAFDTAAPKTLYDESLYLASPGKLLSALVNAPNTAKHVMIVAHNPGIEDLSAYLQGIPGDTMPTAAFRQFECDDVHSLAMLLSAQQDSNKIGTPTKPPGVILVHSDYPKNV